MGIATNRAGLSLRIPSLTRKSPKLLRLLSFLDGWNAATRRTVPDRERITIDSVSAPAPVIRTPRRSAPPVTPVAATNTSSPVTRSTSVSTASRSNPASTRRRRSSSFRGHSFPCSAPPTHLIAAAEITPSGVPPIPIRMSTPVKGCAAAIAGATSPSRIRFTRAPALRSSAIRSSWRSRSSTTTVTSFTSIPFASATRWTFSVGDASMSIASAASGPTAILSMYSAAPGKNIVPRSATAITAIAFGIPSAVSRVPSSGSTATSTAGPRPFPTSSPL